MGNRKVGTLLILAAMVVWPTLGNAITSSTTSSAARRRRGRPRSRVEQPDGDQSPRRANDDHTVDGGRETMQRRQLKNGRSKFGAVQ